MTLGRARKTLQIINKKKLRISCAEGDDLKRILGKRHRIGLGRKGGIRSGV